MIDLRRCPFDPAPPTRDYGLLLLRLAAGLGMAFGHGLGKLPPSDAFVGGLTDAGLPVPGLFAWMAALAEFGGGLLVAAGFLTRPAAMLNVVTMLVAFFGAHAGDPFGEREMAFLYGAMFLAVVLSGAGRFSVDAWRGARA